MNLQDRQSSSDTPFLTDDEKDMEQIYHKRLLPWWHHRGIFALLLTVYTVSLIVATGYWYPQHSEPYQAYTPARGAVKFHIEHFDGSLGLKTVYMGEPRPETEAAWHKLFKNYNLRFTEEEMIKLKHTSVELRNGGGYYGQLSVYHHLHCLKMLRQVLWFDYYNISIPDSREHSDHCIDDIRHALMCLPDLSVTTFDWLEHRRKPWPNFHIDQTCADWDTIDNWAEQRSFTIFDQKTLVHPKFGLSFPMVNGTIQETEPRGPEGDDPTPVWPADNA